MLFRGFISEAGARPLHYPNIPAVRHAQIMRGFPELRQSSSLPRLRLVQNGVRRERGQHGPPPTQRLPITPSILRQIRAVLSAAPSRHDKAMLWVAISGKKLKFIYPINNYDF